MTDAMGATDNDLTPAGGNAAQVNPGLVVPEVLPEMPLEPSSRAAAGILITTPTPGSRHRPTHRYRPQDPAHRPGRFVRHRLDPHRAGVKTELRSFALVHSHRRTSVRNRTRNQAGITRPSSREVWCSRTTVSHTRPARGQAQHASPRVHESLPPHSTHASHVHLHVREKPT